MFTLLRGHVDDISPRLPTGRINLLILSNLKRLFFPCPTVEPLEKKKKRKNLYVKSVYRTSKDRKGFSSTYTHSVAKRFERWHS